MATAGVYIAEGWMVNTYDALNGTFSALLQREKSLFHTSFHSNTPNNSMGKHTHLGANEHLLDIFQMCAHAYTHTHGWTYKHDTNLSPTH